MKIDRAQNEEIGINRQTVTFWFGSGGTAPGKVISELRLTTARWEGSLWLQWVCCWPCGMEMVQMTRRDKRGRMEEKMERETGMWGGGTTSGKNQTTLTECFCRCSGGIFPGCSQPAPVANKKLHACTFNSELGHIINYVNVAEDSEDCCKFLTLSPLSDLMSSTVRTVSYSTALPTVLVLSVLVATCMPSQTHIIS